MNSISIIIVTYKSKNLIKDCVDSIFAHCDVGADQIEIIIVDNSPLDFSEDLRLFIELCYGDRITFIKSHSNLGYGAGNNLGIEYASGDIIAIMNPDVRLTEPLFKLVIDEFKNEKLGLLGFKQKSVSNISFMLKPEFSFSIFDYFINRFLNRVNLFFPKYFFISGAFFFTRKSSFNKIGCFDKNIFLYKEESDISNRFLLSNFQINFIPHKSYVHLIQNITGFSEFTFNASLDSAFYYLDKYNFSKSKYYYKIYFDFLFKYFFYSIIRKESKKLKFKIQLDTLKRYYLKYK